MKKNICILFFLFFISCNSSDKPESEIRIIAKFEGEELYLKDLEGIIPPNSTKQDSTLLIARYADNWLKKKLLANEASSFIKDIDQSDIKEKTDEYRNALIIYEFEKQFLKEKLDTSITEVDLKDFFKTHARDFELKQNIVKLYLIKVSNKSKSIPHLRTEFSGKQVDQYLKLFCTQNTDKCLCIDNAWKSFDEIIKNTPYSQIANKTDWLSKNGLAVMNDEENTYFIKISDFKLQNKTSPYDFVKDQVRSIILNRRKLALITKYEDDLFKKALSEKRIEKY